MPMDPREQREIKALLEVGKEFTQQTDGTPAGIFLSGMLSGLAMAVRIISEGSTAEKEMENLDTQLAAAMGRAFMAGKLAPPTQDGA
ncbi:hypothetical protein [Streptomyces sp. NBRC 110035]|uniref:hypothetical protein n=1 Tax=Streptomyces sp. NBRC 110035 TaxID=1547867 RepID=UPI0005AAF6BE|nr:hypothetical protein [Streptomyces sp. NBRC 110035]